jgi:hypothetical protein
MATSVVAVVMVVFFLVGTAWRTSGTSLGGRRLQGDFIPLVNAHVVVARCVRQRNRGNLDQVVAFEWTHTVRATGGTQNEGIDGNGSLVARPVGAHDGIEGDGDVREGRGDALLTCAEDGGAPGVALERRAAAPEPPVVANGPHVADGAMAMPTHQVASHRGQGAQLGRPPRNRMHVPRPSRPPFPFRDRRSNLATHRTPVKLDSPGGSSLSRSPLHMRMTAPCCVAALGLRLETHRKRPGGG